MSSPGCNKTYENDRPGTDQVPPGCRWQEYIHQAARYYSSAAKVSEKTLAPNKFLRRPVDLQIITHRLL